MARQLDPISLSAFKVTSPQLPDIYFTKCSGIEGTRSVLTYSDGFSQNKQKRVGALEYSNVTLSKPFDPATDASILNLLEGYCEGQDSKLLTVTITPVKICNNVERRGNVSFTLLGCRPVRIKVAETDSDSQDGVSMLEVELTVTSVKR